MTQTDRIELMLMRIEKMQVEQLAIALFNDQRNDYSPDMRWERLDSRVRYEYRQMAKHKSNSEKIYGALD